MGTVYPTPARGSKLTISFGLVNVGVKHAPLVRDQRTRGRYVCPECRGPVTQQYACATHGVLEGRPVSAYEFGDQMIVLEDRDALKSERDGRLELRAFVDPDSVDPLYFEQTNLVWPDKGQEAGYDLLCSALERSGKALVGLAVLTKSTKAVMLRYAQGCLLAHVCTYDANVTWNDHALVSQGHGERPAPAEPLIEMALDLFSNLEAGFDFAEVTDEYDARLRQAIAATAEGRKVTVAPVTTPEPVSDLMDALKASLAASGAKAKGTPKRKRTKKAAA